MASFLKKALPGVLPPALAANPDLNAPGVKSAEKIGQAFAAVAGRRY